VRRPLKAESDHTIQGPFLPDVQGTKNTSEPTESDKQNDTVPLFGLGLAYDLATKTQLYANFSESYRPVIFTQTVPTGAGVTVPNNLEASKALQYELGARSQAISGIVLDASYFVLDFDNQIRQVGTIIVNTGRAIHHGVEASALYDLLSLAENASSHKLEVYANAMFLHAEYVSGPLKDATPQYAPDYLIRSGLIYTAPKGTAKIALLGTFVDDANSEIATAPLVPGHMVWDLTAEARVPRTPSLPSPV
jgi:Fe(3+) dicitrate transport protein